MSKQAKKKKLSEPKNIEDSDVLEENKEFTTIEEFWRFEDALSADERRARYYHGDYYTLQDITTWANYAETIPAVDFKDHRDHIEKLVKSWELLPEPEEWNEDNSSDSDNSATPRERVTGPRELVLDFEPNEELNNKISLWRGDITKLEIDAVVNAANESLLGGGGIDGAIHAAAGPTLVEECALLHGCSTVGPRCYNTITKLPVEKLQRCYTSCLSHVSKHKLKSVAFCCISTGIFSYPNEAAAFTALLTIRDWLTKNDNYKRIDRVILCVFEEKDLKIYEQMMQVFFPPVRHSKNVQLPCYSADKWSKIKKFVKKNAIDNVDELCKFIREFSPEQSLDLSNFKLLFDKLGDAETSEFFSKTLPTVLRLAMRLDGICQEEQRQHDLLEDVRSNTPEFGAIPLLVRTVKNSSVTLSQEKIASLVACAFLCLLPQQKFHNQMFASPNFKQLYTKIATSEVDHVLPNQANKLRCLIHYFNRVNDSMPEGFVKIERRNFTSPMEKLDRQDNLSTAWHLPVIFSDAPPHAPKQQEDGVVLLDGNEFPASTFLNPRDMISPAEGFCLTNPELTILPLITSQLVNWESIEVRGSETFCECSVDKAGRNFRYLGDYKDHIKRDNRLKKRTLVFIDSPVCGDKLQQLKRHNVLLEYHNVYAALMPHIRDRTVSIFYGDGGHNESIGTDLQIKTMILLIAIHAIGCKNNVVNEALGSKDKIKSKNQAAPVLLHLSNYAHIEQFIAAINVLKKEEVSSWRFVERLWTDFIEPSNEDLFVRIKSRFKGWRKEAKQLHKKKDKEGKQKARTSASIPRRKTDMGTSAGQHKPTSNNNNNNATAPTVARSSTGLAIFSPRTQKSARDLKKTSVESNANKSDILTASESRQRGRTIDGTADSKAKNGLEPEERKEKSKK